MRATNLKITLPFLILLIVVACSTKSQQLKATANPAKAEMDIFLLIGQSNMQGVAPIGALDTVGLKNVYLFNDKNEWEIAKNILPDNGMNRYSTVKRKPVTLFGPAYTFARRIEQYSHRTTGIISNARGSTRIEWWQKGFEHDSTYRGESDFDLFEEAVKRTKAALATNPNAKLRGILWHQGEANNAPTRSTYYMLRLKTLVNDLRKEFNNPELPFIAGEVGKWNNRGTNVNPIIREIKNEIPFTDWVSSDGYTSIDLEKNDPHFDNLSQRSFGERYADKAAELVYHIHPKGATLFNATNYGGRSVLLTEGSYNAIDLERMGILPSEIKSIELNPGYEVLFTAKNDKKDFVASTSALKNITPELVEVKKLKH